jgi:hypothetical protein
MQKQWLLGVVGLGSILTVLSGISPAMGEINKLGGDERPVMEAMETASFGTEGWVPPQGEAPVVAMATPSFGTEDWIGPKEQAPIVAMATPSFGTEDWIGVMESSEALGAGATAAPDCEELSWGDYSPEC